MQELPKYQAKIAAPFAVLGIHTIGERVVRIDYLPSGIALLEPQNQIAREAARQIAAYLRDASFHLDFPHLVEGTDFQVRVWKQIRSIGSGETLSYSEVASRIGSAARPVGTACGANRIPLLIPCHRVVASNGIGGFMHSRKGHPLEIKRWLLTHEKAARHP